MSVCVPLAGDQEQCQLVVATRPEYHIPLENVVWLLASFERSGLHYIRQEQKKNGQLAIF
jgi:hypothetical protein